jgi:hypothetical protein
MAIGQINSHGIHRKVTPSEINFYRQRMIKRDRKITVSYARGDFSPWERYVDGRASPAMGQQFDHSKRAPGELDTPV